MVFWRRSIQPKDGGVDGGGSQSAALTASGTGASKASAPDRFGGTGTSEATQLPGAVAGGPTSEESDEDEDDDDDDRVARAEAPQEIPSEAGEEDDDDRGADDNSDLEEGDLEGSEEEEEDIDDMWEKFEANLAAMHPKLQDVRNLVTDEDIILAVKTRRNPAVSDNSRFVMGSRPRDVMGTREVPPLIGVSGHGGTGGNLGINGIYELYPGLFHDRPVYQKVLEKRAVRDLMAAPPGGLLADREPLRTPRSRLEAKCNQRKFIMKAPREAKGPRTMWPVPNAWFLFFDKGIGCWCIGSSVGHTEIYARCPGTEELVPDRLDRWQVWNCGGHKWSDNGGLCTFKGGSDG